MKKYYTFVTWGEGTMRNLLYITAIMTMAATPAFCSGLPDGTYGCYIGSNSFLGAIEIAGNVYRGPAFDGQYEGEYPLEVTDGGTINWGGPLGGISSSGNVVSTVLTNAGNNNVGFDITIQNNEGNFQTISCSPQ